MIINIYSNPNNEESYRQVKRTNRQLNDLLVKYKNGLKLLDELGFREKDEHWINTVESKYLKIYKTDFDVGYKRYKSQGVENGWMMYDTLKWIACESSEGKVGLPTRRIMHLDWCFFLIDRLLLLLLRARRLIDVRSSVRLIGIFSAFVWLFPVLWSTYQ